MPSAQKLTLSDSPAIPFGTLPKLPLLLRNRLDEAPCTLKAVKLAGQILSAQSTPYAKDPKRNQILAELKERAHAALERWSSDDSKGLANTIAAVLKNDSKKLEQTTDHHSRGGEILMQYSPEAAKAALSQDDWRHPIKLLEEWVQSGKELPDSQLYKQMLLQVRDAAPSTEGFDTLLKIQEPIRNTASFDYDQKQISIQLLTDWIQSGLSSDVNPGIRCGQGMQLTSLRNLAENIRPSERELSLACLNILKNKEINAENLGEFLPALFLVSHSFRDKWELPAHTDEITRRLPQLTAAISETDPASPELSPTASLAHTIVAKSLSNVPAQQWSDEAFKSSVVAYLKEVRHPNSLKELYLGALRSAEPDTVVSIFSEVVTTLTGGNDHDAASTQDLALAQAIADWVRNSGDDTSSSFQNEPTGESATALAESERWPQILPPPIARQTAYAAAGVEPDTIAHWFQKDVPYFELQLTRLLGGHPKLWHRPEASNPFVVSSKDVELIDPTEALGLHSCTIQGVEGEFLLVPTFQADPSREASYKLTSLPYTDAVAAMELAFSQLSSKQLRELIYREHNLNNPEPQLMDPANDKNSILYRYLSGYYFKYVNLATVKTIQNQEEFTQWVKFRTNAATLFGDSDASFELRPTP